MSRRTGTLRSMETPHESDRPSKPDAVAEALEALAVATPTDAPAAAEAVAEALHDELDED